MGILTIILIGCASLIILNLHPHHEVKAISVITPVTEGESSSDSGNDTAAGRQLFGASTTPPTPSGGTVPMEHLIVVLCDGLQNMVARCSFVPRLEDFMRNNNLNFFFPSIGRKRRFASNFGSGLFSNSWFGPSSGTGSSSFFGPSFGSNSFHAFDPWPSSTTTSGSSNTHFGGSSHVSNANNIHFGGSSHLSKANTIICPSQVNQSAIFNLSPNATGYPITGIATELNNNPVLRACLFREVVVPNAQPNITEESFRDNAIVTCPFTQLRLWRYQSSRAGTLCWILQNFQENVLYKECGTRFCNDCKSKTNNARRQKLCIIDFATVSVWSYCPGRPQNQRVIRDRIIIPQACTCQSVLCEQVPRWRK